MTDTTVQCSDQRRREGACVPALRPGLRGLALAALLQDPVAAGVPMDYDRGLPPSVISAVQVTAQDERCDQFKVSRHPDTGLTENQRFLNVVVGGAPSNIGDSHELKGLGIRSSNLAVDHLNALSDQPFLKKRAEPLGEQRNVVHRSDPGEWVHQGVRQGWQARRDRTAGPGGSARERPRGRHAQQRTE